MKTLMKRLEERIGAPDAKGCMPWVGALNQFGYGNINAGRQTMKAHRVAWLLAKGDIPEGFHVLHQCDNPSCVNVDHLFVGTHSQNMQDMLQKGRGNKASGDRHGMKRAGWKVAGSRNGRFKGDADAR